MVQVAGVSLSSAGACARSALTHFFPSWFHPWPNLSLARPGLVQHLAPPAPAWPTAIAPKRAPRPGRAASCGSALPGLAQQGLVEARLAPAAGRARPGLLEVFRARAPRPGPASSRRSTT
eukprot:12327879-Alexandrium_andersonii.AAC.1